MALANCRNSHRDGDKNKKGIPMSFCFWIFFTVPWSFKEKANVKIDAKLEATLEIDTVQLKTESF